MKEAFSVEGFPNTSGLVKRKDVLAEKDAIVVLFSFFSFLIFPLVVPLPF